MDNSPTITTASWFDDRCYRVNTKGGIFDIASVTTKLGIEEKPFLLKWYADLGWDEARRQLHEAGDRGKRIHFALWVYLNGGTVLYNPWQNPFYLEAEIDQIKKDTNGLFMVLKNQDEMVALWKLKRFFECVKPRIVCTEETVFSIEKDIAGTMDIALHIEKGTYDCNGSLGLIVPETGVYIADLKTGSNISDSAWAQMAAYTEAFEELKNTKVSGAIVLHTSASTKKGIEAFAAPLKTRQDLEPHYKIYQSLSYVWKQRNPNFGPKLFEFPTRIDGLTKQA